MGGRVYGCRIGLRVSVEPMPETMVRVLFFFFFWTAPRLTGQDLEADQPPRDHLMIRCDVFREFRAREINSTPGPAEALHELTEVLAEVARTDLVSDGLGDSTATVS